MRRGGQRQTVAECQTGWGARSSLKVPGPHWGRPVREVASVVGGVTASEKRAVLGGRGSRAGGYDVHGPVPRQPCGPPLPRLPIEGRRQRTECRQGRAQRRRVHLGRSRGWGCRCRSRGRGRWRGESGVNRVGGGAAGGWLGGGRGGGQHVNRHGARGHGLRGSGVNGHCVNTGAGDHEDRQAGQKPHPLPRDPPHWVGRPGSVHGSDPTPEMYWPDSLID